MNILTVLGARPQFVKAAVVSREIASRENLHEIIVHTGQHFDINMSDIFFSEMDIPKPNYNLNVNGMSHGRMTGRMLENLEEVILKEKPDMLLVYGDTNSTLAGALSAAKLRVPIAHIEAGLRSFNMDMPEEINRILTDRVSKWLFCPTQTAIDNLKKEGYDEFENHMHLSGDVMLDATLYYSAKLDQATLSDIIPKEPFVLVTIHRQENITDIRKLKDIILILNELSENTRIVFPIHPGTYKRILEAGIKLKFNTIEPVGYLSMIQLLQKCEFVVTDSGGLQKEAFFHNKYCFTLREETEWVELVNSGVNYICGTDESLFFQYLNELPDTFPSGLTMYGNGDAGKKIVDQLVLDI